MGKPFRDTYDAVQPRIVAGEIQVSEIACRATADQRRAAKDDPLGVARVGGRRCIDAHTKLPRRDLLPQRLDIDLGGRGPSDRSALDQYQQSKPATGAS